MLLLHLCAHGASGATDAEVQEAIAYGAETRLWSTILNGNQHLAHVAEAQKSN